MTAASRGIRISIVCAMIAVDGLIIFDSFSLAYLLRFRFFFLATEYLQPAPVGEYMKAMVVVTYFWILLFAVFGLYDFERQRSGIDTAHLVVKAVTFGTLIILSLTYFYREFSFSRLVCVYAWVISVILFCVFRISINLFRSDWYRGGRNLRRIVVVGSRTLARFLVEKVRAQPELGYEVVGTLDTTPPEASIPECEHLGGLDRLDEVLKFQRVDSVLIAHPTIGHYDLLDVIHACERVGVPIRMVPPTYDLLVNYRDLEEVDGIPLVRINEQSTLCPGDVAKRIFDTITSLAVLLMTMPFWIPIAIAIKLEDGGSIFFKQVRVGRNGESFRMWKFRTMVRDADARLAEVVDFSNLDEPVYKLEDDPRITRVGRFLRRTSLDEVPQVLNVLAGQMSLVGPRPEEERLVRLYNVWERRRLKSIPGITGLQQVKCRGSVSLHERVKWDVLYVRKRSFVLDVWILLQTAWVVVSGKGAR